MREFWARLLALITGAMVIALSAGFAWVQNPAGSSDAMPTATPVAAAATGASPEQIARGRALFDEQDCTRCHSVAGHGSPRSPLDGVGSRLDAQGLRHWMTGDASVQEELAPRVLSAKVPYQALPEEQLDALVAYLQGLQ
jgi:cytochrome c5